MRIRRKRVIGGLLFSVERCFRAGETAIGEEGVEDSVMVQVFELLRVIQAEVFISILVCASFNSNVLLLDWSVP